MKTYQIPHLAALAGILMLSTATVLAEDNFWQSPQSAVVSDYAAYSLMGHEDLSTQLSSSEYLDINGRRAEQSSLSITQNFSDTSALTFEYASSRAQKNAVLGFTQNHLSVSFMAGSGEDYASLSGDYAGVDPYLFHGGYKQDFKTRGFAIDYGFAGFGHVQLGQATVASQRLQNRKAQYVEWSNNRLYARASRFVRGAEDIGNGLDLGFAIGANKLLAVQAMQLDNERRMQRLRLQFNGSHSRQYWVDFSSHQNSLFKQNDDFQVMFNFKTLLGSRQLASYQNGQVRGIGAGDGDVIEDESGTASAQQKKGRGWKRAVFIGAGVGAAAALSSSGSSTQDNNARFRTQHDAAFDVLNGINPTSISLNREFGGWVFVSPDGSFSSTVPVQGEAASVVLPERSVAIPAGSRATASYHTHAAFDPLFDNENFSPTDLDLNRRAAVDGYLGTPGGQFKFHDVSSDTVTTLGSIATQ